MWSQVFLPFPSALLPSWWRMYSKFCCCKALTKREVWLRAGTSLARSAAAILPRNRALKQDWETCEATTLPHGDQKWDLYKFPAIQQKWINHGKPYPISCIWARWKFGAPLWRGQPPFSDVLPPRLGPGQTWTWVGIWMGFTDSPWKDMKSTSREGSKNRNAVYRSMIFPMKSEFGAIVPSKCSFS